jgi:tRNA-binding protein
MTKTISMDTFRSLDIIVGKIISVEDFPTAKNPLYIIQIDFGDYILQTCAGLRDIKTKKELIGLHVICLTNIEPKQIGNHISECLILAAKDKNKNPNLLCTEKSEKIGSKIF